MAWTDPATDRQVSALCQMFSWKIVSADCKKRYAWLMDNKPTRKEISEEMSRVRQLCIDNNTVFGYWSGGLEEQLFNSKIWEGYNL